MARLKPTDPSSGCLIIFGSIFLIPGLGFLVGAISSGEFGLAIPAGIFGLVGGAITGIGVHQKLGASLFKDFYVDVPHEFTRLGETITARVGFTAGRQFRMDKGTLKHFMEEKAVWRRGTDSRTYQKNLFETVKALPAGRELRPGESYSAEVELTMPTDAPSSFKAEHNSLTWQLSVTFDVPGWPDPSFDFELPMAPRLATGAARPAAEDDEEWEEVDENAPEDPDYEYEDESPDPKGRR